MSWTATTGVVRKSEAKRALNELTLQGQCDPWAKDQFEETKDVALLLIKSVPGPYVTINMSGHANGVGYSKKDTWSNDFVSVSISQQTDEDLKRYGFKVQESTTVTSKVKIDKATI